MSVVALEYPHSLTEAKPRQRREPAPAPNPARALEPEAWVDKHGDYLYSYALLRVRNRELAEELVQETFLAALKSCKNFAQQSSERTWLIGILKHKIVDHFRRTSRERPVADFEANPSDDDLFRKSGEWLDHWTQEGGPKEWTDDPSQLVEQKEFWEVFNRCLAQLSPRLAEAFTLREIDGLSSEEVCEILSITPNNLWVMLHRARALLRRSLEMNWLAHQA
ncbi:sigma-70 family RNA polymerase sigma factor [candidate division KSB1 bacterium]|nr:sigma-70 family RNA polymerase sigma factor [candidate division KSB1 bacterium]